MDAALADRMIYSGKKLVFVRHAGANQFVCKFPFDLAFTEKCRVIPSFASKYKPDPTGERKKGIFVGWNIHYLDLPILEAVSFGSGYSVDYEDREILRKMKADYLDKREWKLGKLARIRSFSLRGPRKELMYYRQSDGVWAFKEEVPPMTRAEADKLKASDPKFKDDFVEPVPIVIVPAVRPLDDLQNVGAGALFRAQKDILADGMGAGKTAQAIGAVILNKLDGRPHKTLVLCPTTVKGAWRGEVEDMTKDLKALILNKNMEKRFEQYPLCKDYDVIIASYGTFLSDYQELAEFVNPDILIIDEAHRLCNKDNKSTQLLIGGKEVKKTFLMMAKPHSIYLVTGTPINNELEDLYATLKTLDSAIFHWGGFRNRYTILKEGSRWERKMVKNEETGVMEPKASKRLFYTTEGYKNEAELKGKLGLHMIRRTKDEILPNLPPKSYTFEDVILDEEERKIYDDLKEKWQAFVRGKGVAVKSHLSWMIRAQQICNSLETYPDAGGIKKSSKLKALLRIVDREAPKRKIIIFSKFAEMTKIIERELKVWHPIHMNGDTPDEDRYDMWHEMFQKDPKYRAFVTTIECGGAGITLNASNLVIFYDKGWTLKSNEQAADRSHRRGQENDVEIKTLRVVDSIDEHIEMTWINKGLLVDSTINVEKAVRDMLLEQKEALI